MIGNKKRATTSKESTFGVKFSHVQVSENTFDSRLGIYSTRDSFLNQVAQLFFINPWTSGASIYGRENRRLAISKPEVDNSETGTWPLKTGTWPLKIGTQSFENWHSASSKPALSSLKSAHDSRKPALDTFEAVFSFISSNDTL